MNFSRISVNRPVTTIMVVLIVVLVGTVSLIGIPMDLLPDINLPVAIAYVQYPNAAPQEVESMVTVPLEQALSSVSGMDTIASMTTEGVSIVMVSFEMKTDMDFATLDMREKIALVESFLPEDATAPMVIKMSMDFTPVVQLYISSDNMELADLNQMVQDELLSYFERTDGVASISAFGGIAKEVAITFDQDKLTGYGLSLSTVAQLLAAENINLPSGEVSKGNTKMVVRTLGEFQSVDDIRSLPLTLADGSIVRLGDIAGISEGFQEQTSISRVDGRTAVGISISKQSTANTVQVSNAVQDTIQQLEKKYPELSFTVGMDQADYIKGAIRSVGESALLGALLAIFVIFLFLRSISSTLVIAIAIPTALFATFGLMNLANMTLNMITLCALTLAVGMLVDNSIVVSENIYRVKQEEKLNAYEASLKGSKQVILAVSASTLTSIVVYLPIALSDGMASLLFEDFCWTIIIALAASLVVSLSVVPMLSSKLLRGVSSTDHLRLGSHRYNYKLLPQFSRFIGWLIETYGQAIGKYLKKRKRVIIVCILIFVLSCGLIALMGMEFFPASDEGMFAVYVDMPYGTSLAEKDAVLTEIETSVLAIPEMEHCSVDIGLTSAMLGSQSSSISVILSSKEERDRSITEIMDELEGTFQDIPGADIYIVETSSFTSMMGGTDLSLSISGPELEELRTIGEDLAAQLLTIPGVEETSTSITEGNPEVQVVLNRSTAAYYGITAYQLASSLGSALSGTSTTNLKVDGEEIAINLSLADEYNNSVDNMQQIMIPTAFGTTVPVGQIATLVYDNSPTQIDRTNQQRYISINVGIAGADLSAASEAVLAYVNDYPFPEGYRYEEGGMYEQMMDAFGDLFLALLAAVLLVFMVMAAQFESLLMSLIVMLSVPFAMSGAFIALFLTGNTLSLTSFTGLIILVGIVVNNAILLVEFIKLNKETMERDQAIVLAGKYRLRPILMTTLTTCVGMIPLALGRGDGGEILAPLAISVIGGLAGSTLVTLFLVPVFYAMIDDRRLRRLAKKEAKLQRILALEEKWKEEDEARGKH